MLRLAAAKVTLLRPNPWPFNDGVVFFNNSYETDKVLVTPDDSKCRMLESRGNDNSLAIAKYGENVETNGFDHFGVDGLECNEFVDSPQSHSSGVKSLVVSSTANGANFPVVIPGVVVRDEITDLGVRDVGFGEIAARFLGKDCICRIWCEWLEVKSVDSEDLCKVPEHDFAVVTFSYNIDLGRKGFLDDVRMLLSSSPRRESGNGEGTGCKRKKSFSDPEDISDSLNNQYDSFGEDSYATSGASRLILDHYDDQLLNSRFILNKSIRRELRRQQRLASGRMCDICQQRMLPGKDVATLMNMKTGRLACSSRNVNGAFHVFHTSCLIHWILLCEVEIITNQNTGSKVRRRSRRKTAAKCNGNDAQLKSLSPQIYSVFCPECQGTGIVVDGDDLEKPNLPVSDVQVQDKGE
ncbi:uncharacterized protein LOC126785723 [Argentina anserina]|uniref:uncharacterized protein LOC126785723 n=1 Tax=Argentina anserina TaxID=57926 RepID=UPI00217688A6|nr:uncharacterized protein LOC126785723 [Potentilla anserina]